MKADPKTEAEVIATMRAFDEALARGDLDAIMALHSPEFIAFGTGTDEKQVGLDDLRRLAHRDMEQADKYGFHHKWISVSLHGSLALVAQELELQWGVKGWEFTAAARMTSVFEQHEGRWRYLQRHISFPASNQASGQSYPTTLEAVAAVVAREHPDLSAQAAPDGTVTMLFTDIENSTNLTERLGDTQWLEVLRQHNAIVREQMKEHGCFEVKSQGDGFMIASQSARRAVHCAIRIQQELARCNEETAEPIQVRMGLHTGEVLKDAEDFFGKHVIMASRIAGKARGGEILVSSLLRDLTESAGDISFGDARDVELKGLSGTYQVYGVRWRKP